MVGCLAILKSEGAAAELRLNSGAESIRAERVLALQMQTNVVDIQCRRALGDEFPIDLAAFLGGCT